MAHQFDLRVYYEDTDFGGIVYYANYLKFIERARSEWVRELGIDQIALKDQQKIVFAVRRVEADYLAPARFEDEITVFTRVLSSSPARLKLNQIVRRGEVKLFEAIVTLVALGPSGAPVRLPEPLRTQA